MCLCLCYCLSQNVTDGHRVKRGTRKDGRRVIQCVPKKRTTYFQTAVTPLRIVEIKKVGRDSERARADLSETYNFFSVTQLGAEIFEFKDDPVPKILCKKY